MPHPKSSHTFLDPLKVTSNTNQFVALYFLHVVHPSFCVRIYSTWLPSVLSLHFLILETSWPALLLLSSCKAMSGLCYFLLPVVETSLVPPVPWNLAGSRAVLIDTRGFLNPFLVLPSIPWRGSDHTLGFLPLQLFSPGLTWALDYSHHFIAPSLSLFKCLKFFTRLI